MTVEMCGIKVILGRVDIRQRRRGRENRALRYADRCDVTVIILGRRGRENRVHRYADRFDVNVNNVKLIYFAK